MKRKIKVKREFLRASFQPSSFNDADNSVEVVFSTGAKVKRFSFSEGEFYEELSLKRSHVNLERFKSGAPVLDSHDSYRLDDVIGKVESARIEKNKKGEMIGIAKVRLTNRPERAGTVQDIRDGIVTKLSIGYRVNKFEELKERFEDLPILRAVDWEPMELSFVPIPADNGAQARNLPKDDFEEIEVIRTETKGGTMRPFMKKKKEAEAKRALALQLRTDGDEEKAVEAEAEAEVLETEAAELEAADKAAEEKAAADKAAEEKAAAEKEEADKAAAEKEEAERAAKASNNKVDPEAIRLAEIKRQDDIRSAVKVAKLDDKFADELCRNAKVTVDEARSQIFKEMEKRTSGVTMNQRVEVKDMEQKELRRKAAVRGLLHRSNPEKHKLEAGDNEFRTDSLIQTARNFLAMEGVSNAHQLTKNEVATRALHHSSDFPSVLADVSNKSLQESYASAPATFMPFVNTTSVPDFKNINKMKLSDGGRLTPVNEHGEYERTTLEESKETYKVEKFGKIIGRTWELMMNDDLGAFTEIAAKLGKRAREKESEIFWNLIINAQIMAETGFALFNAAHNNLDAAPSAISIPSLGKGRQAMRTHLDLDGELIGGLNAQYLVTPAALETVGNQFLSTVNPNQNSQVNPFSNSLQQIVEPRLDAASTTAWYMFAATSMIDMAEMARLDGRGPEISVREGFEVDGMETKIRYVFGMRILDYRGFYKNAGV